MSRAGGILTTVLVAAWAAAAGSVAACDPDHAWSPMHEASRIGVSSRALDSLVAHCLASLSPPMSADDRIAVLHAADQSDPGGAGPSGATTSANLLPDLLERLEAAFARSTGAPWIGLDRVDALRGESGLDPSAIFDPAFLARIARETGATLFLKVGLVQSLSDFRLLEDLNPANPGLRAAQVFETTRVRLSLQAVDGSYRFIDELDGHASESYLYVHRNGEPDRVVEVQLSRPDGPPLYWSANPDHRHFSF